MSPSSTHRLIEGALLIVDPLHGETLLRLYPVVVGLLQVGFVRAVVPIMLVRRVAGPVASRGDDLDDEQSLCGLALHEDIPDLPLVGPRPARAHLDVLRLEKARLYPPPGRGGGDRKLQIRRSLDTVLCCGGR